MARLVRYCTTICDSKAAGERLVLPVSNDRGSRRGASAVFRLKRNSATYWSAAMTNKYEAASAIGSRTTAANDSIRGDSRELIPARASRPVSASRNTGVGRECAFSAARNHGSLAGANLASFSAAAGGRSSCGAVMGACFSRIGAAPLTGADEHRVRSRHSRTAPIGHWRAPRPCCNTVELYRYYESPG